MNLFKGLMRTHTCGSLSNCNGDLNGITVCGWVSRRRDHGGVIFLDLRDFEGIIQIVVGPETQKAFQEADRVRPEWVISVLGYLRNRPEGTENSEMFTGNVELVAAELTILSIAQTPPFQLDKYAEVGEDIRLAHRYLDLRRTEMGGNLRFRSKVTNFIRNYLIKCDFVDVETPILTRATPEGARDYLVPSRTNKGQFFALPQSPQLFKQLLMISGLDRYFQIAKCFRDEDLRADRQPEFTQVDIEMSFVTEETIMSLSEEMIRCLFSEILNVELNDFPQISFDDSITVYGTDKPDLRNPLKLIDIADLVKATEFKVFQEPARDNDGRVVALCVTGGSVLTRSQIDNYTDFVSSLGAKGLAWIKVIDRSLGINGLQSPILKFIPDSIIEQILDRNKATNGDILFFGAGKSKLVSDSIGALRVKLGEDLNLLTDKWSPVWVVSFPMFEFDNSRIKAAHHPFTAPSCDADTLRRNPFQQKSRAYDMVLNGIEIGGGSIRIHDQEMQKTVFELLEIGEKESRDKFGFLLDALKHGAPPHGGIALGLDRLIMLMLGTKSIRDVIAFPKTQNAACLTTGAPGSVDTSQLRELGIRQRAQTSSA